MLRVRLTNGGTKKNTPNSVHSPESFHRPRQRGNRSAESVHNKRRQRTRKNRHRQNAESARNARKRRIGTHGVGSAESFHRPRQRGIGTRAVYRDITRGIGSQMQAIKNKFQRHRQSGIGPQYTIKKTESVHRPRQCEIGARVRSIGIDNAESVHSKMWTAKTAHRHRQRGIDTQGVDSEESFHRPRRSRIGARPVYMDRSRKIGSQT